MSNTTKEINVQDFYKTTLIDSISSTWDVDFEVWTAPTYTRWFIIINPESSALRERMYYHDVIWNRVYVKWINRIEKKEHDIWATIQINDLSLIFNYLSDISSTTFYVEKIRNLVVNIWWWPILKDNQTISVADTLITLVNDSINYIYYDKDNNLIESSTVLSTAEEWIITAEITTASWIISSINYRNYKLNTLSVTEWASITEAEFSWNDILFTKSDWWEVVLQDAKTELKWDKWDKWDIWDIWNPWTEWQNISDINTLQNWYAVVTDNSTYVKIIEQATLNSTLYNLTWIYTLDWESNVTSSNLATWTWGVIWTIEWVVYSFLNIDTLWTIRYIWKPAYRDQSNTFQDINTFEDTTIFKWNAIFPYYINTANTELFDCSLWTKQKFSWNDWLAHTLDFENLNPWNSLVFVINVSSSSCTINKWTATWIDSDWTTKSYNFYSIWWTTYPLTLAVGTHFFIWEVFSDAIHLMYSWVSVAI